MSAAKASKIVGTSIEALTAQGLVTPAMDGSETATTLKQPKQQQMALHRAQLTGVHIQNLHSKMNNSIKYNYQLAINV